MTQLNVFNRQAFSPFHIHHPAGRGTNAFNGAIK